MPDRKRVAVIMAGGSGERFWPLSRSLRPKQFLRMDGSKNTLLEQAIEAEAQAQAICMQTKDFERAYVAFASKQKPVFEGD